MAYQINSAITGFVCLRCRRKYPRDFPAADRGQGCPSCADEGYPVSLALAYRGPGSWTLYQNQRGLLRYSGRLPYLTFPGLGAAGTPLLSVPNLAQDLGIETLWLKNEGQNPTGSHKDRMSPFVVARAADLGIDTVAIASSGNAGASLAAYATVAGLHCVVVTTPDISPSWSRAIRAYGAELIQVDGALERWHKIGAEVEAGRWYPATNHLRPPLGSNPYGLQGYKTVSWEILETIAASAASTSTAQTAPAAKSGPTALVVPADRGDLLWGIWQGLLEAKEAGLLQRLPRLFAVEPFARLSKVLAGADYRAEFPGQAPDMPSIAGNTVTYQSVVALRDSGGLAVEANSQEAAAAQSRLARRGFYVERSSAAALAGLRKLIAQGQVSPTDRVVLVITSHGYKEDGR